MDKKNSVMPSGIASILFLYIILSCLFFFLSSNFITDILQHGSLDFSIQLVVFFFFFCAMLVVLLYYIVSLGRDYFSKKNSARLQARLNMYFGAVILLTTLPFTVILPFNLQHIIKYFNSWNIENTLAASENLAIDNYTLRVNEALQKLHDPVLDETLSAIQIFYINENKIESEFQGVEKYKLNNPPAAISGLAGRDSRKDRDIIRYIDANTENIIKVYTFSLGEGFDSTVEDIKTARFRFESAGNVFNNYNRLILIYFIIFILPLILISIMISINFSRKVSAPIIELNNAAKKTVQGDYSIQIYSHDKDEFKDLVYSFNTMIQSLKQFSEARIRAENMSVWQNMARQLAHEIKNPLTPVKLQAERVLRRFHNNPENLGEILEASMNIITKEIDNLTSLLDEFRTLTRPIEIKNAKTPLCNVIDECISIFSATYPEIRFNSGAVNRSLVLIIDEVHLKQVINNLIINAIDAVDKSGVIEISAQLQNTEETPLARISISDNGKGIDSSIKDKIFTPYWTSKPTGTGLGLPIVERIVCDYGGSISFNSTKGVGSTFIILLPCETL